VALGKVYDQRNIPTEGEKRAFTESDFFEAYGQSVKMTGGNGIVRNNEWAVYKSDQAYPVYVIYYQTELEPRYLDSLL